MYGSKVLGLVSLDSCAYTCIVKGIFFREFMHDLNNNWTARRESLSSR